MKKEKTREIILNGLLINTTIRETANATGISEATIYRYLKDEDFKKEYENKRRAMLTDNCHRMQASMERAVNELVAVIDDKSNSAQVRLNAIDMLLRHTYRMTEQIDILDRLEKLEEMRNNL